MTRRELIQKVITGGVTLVVLPSVLDSCTKIDPGTSGNNNSNKLTIDLTNPTFSALNTTGGSVVYKGLIVANTGSDQFVVLSSICTHAGCTITYNHASNNFPCPCHGSIFSSTGSVIQGPATAAVKKYTVSKLGDILTINLV